jgi:DNA-binding winged helix-turn-helix (wHTH) protein
MRIRFGEFAFDPDARELRLGSQPVHLSPKAFQLLAILVDQRPKALSKAELHLRLWPDTFVVEANLANLVAEIRGALGDDPRRGGFVRTVHRFGYAFRADTAAEQPERQADGGERTRLPPAFRLVWKGGRATIGQGEHILGRDPELELCLDSTTISRRHARIRISDEQATLEDLGSKNGTFLNERKLDAPAPLADGDEIRLGALRVTFRRLAPPASTETAATR